MPLKVITYPDPILKKKSQAVLIEDIKGNEIQELIPKMVKTMLKKDGLGLAAPQIGLSIRIIVIHTKDGDQVLINPKIVSRSIKKEVSEEGCLSLPGQYGLVKRYKKIKVSAYDAEAKKIKLKAKGLLARVIQHEIDHLDGILFIDKIVKKRRKFPSDLNL